MNDTKNIRIFAAFIFMMMAIGSGVFEKLFNSPNAAYAIKQVGLLAFLIVLSFVFSLLLVRVLKVKFKA